MKKSIAFYLLSLLLFIHIPFSSNAQPEPADEVNPFIGTGGHGHTYPGASLPFGFVQLSPDTRLTGWDGCSGYHYSDSVVYGFSHRHLSGTGILDYADILFMPATGKVRFNNGAETSHKRGYGSLFSHDREEASPGYYSVFLEDYDIKAELTATLRTGMHRYHFENDEPAHVIVDLEHRDKVIDSELEVLNDSTIRGYRLSSSWADSQFVYFYARFSEPFKETLIRNEGENKPGQKVSGKAIKAALKFGNMGGKTLQVKVGISAVDTAGARKNQEAENPGWDFDTVHQKARNQWNQELSKIRAEGGRKEDRVKFYTGLYHAFLSPDIYSDVDGRYRGHDGQIHQVDNTDIYTVYSLWDTFRATHPLFTLTQQERTNDFIRTFLNIYEQGGQLPVWELSAHESFVMIGYHAIPVIADAYMKGIRDYDTDKALKAMKHSAQLDHFGLKWYRQLGYIPSGKEGESVSKTLEYAYDDWCIARMAMAMGDTAGFQEYSRRAQYYKNVFDPSTKFMRARSNGGWDKPFDPREVNFNYTEANAWQYRFFVPQDVEGLIEIMGGPAAFEAALDSMFTERPQTTGRNQADITGLIGQYAHGNEPSHHMAYLYNYVGKPEKTQRYVGRIMEDLYTTQPDGLSGNEDCGQMSAWYVFSAMGFYPVTPAADDYTMGRPIFPKVTMNLENGRQFVVEAKNLDEENHYVEKVTLNGKKWDKSYLPHKTIMQGGKMTFYMASEPGKAFGKGRENLPQSLIKKHPITTTPFVESGSRVFRKNTEISLGSLEPESIIRFEMGDKEVTEDSPGYEEPLTFENTTDIRFRAFHPDFGPSPQVSATFTRLHPERNIEILTGYSSQYMAGGDQALIDGIRGGKNFRTGAWQGYYNNDLIAVVDLGKLQKVDSVGLSCLQDMGSWIFMPQWVRFEVAGADKEFQEIGRIENDVSYKEEEPVLKTYKVACDREIRYIKVHAKIIDIIPEWHKGAGNPGFIFADEIVIE